MVQIKYIRHLDVIFWILVFRLSIKMKTKDISNSDFSFQIEYSVFRFKIQVNNKTNTP